MAEGQGTPVDDIAQSDQKLKEKAAQLVGERSMDCSDRVFANAI